MKNFKSSAYAEQDRLEAEGKSDCWSARQPSIMPVIGDLFVGFNIEMLFQYKDQDRTSYANWCHGVVQSIVNAQESHQKQKRSCYHQNGTQIKQQHGQGDNILVGMLIKI